MAAIPHPVAIHEGRVVFSCCGLTQVCPEAQTIHRVRCESCGVVYGLGLNPHYSYTDAKFRYGDQVRLTEPYKAVFRTDTNLANPRTYSLTTDTAYEVVEDLYQVINPLPSEVLLTVPYKSSDSIHKIVLAVPINIVEKIPNQPSPTTVDEFIANSSTEVSHGQIQFESRDS